MTLTYLGADYKTFALHDEADVETTQGEGRPFLGRTLALTFETESVPGLVPGVTLEVGEAPNVEQWEVIQTQRENDGNTTVALCARVGA